MTTEIAVMNRMGVALAADSAATVDTEEQINQPGGHKRKVFFTSNKLFALSKYAPVGLMIYGNSILMNIPWEIIVKSYRRSLGKRRFSSLKEYCGNFFEYLSAFNIGQDNEKEHICKITFMLVSNIRHNVDRYVNKTIKEKGKISEEDIKKHLNNFIDEENKKFLGYMPRSVLNESEINTLRERYSKDINSIIANILNGLPVDSDHRNTLLKVIYMAIAIPRGHQSGIVISGFGESEIFPSCYEFNVDAVISGKVLKEDARSMHIGNENPAYISSFAQAEEVAVFMEGIGGNIKQLIKSSLHELLTLGLPNNVTSLVKTELKIDDGTAKKMHGNLYKMGQGAFNEFDKFLNEAIHKSYVNPVLEAVKFINKGELARMAEMLVNLVSFRKQVTLVDETVGGPIDVALITKGDGLIWIKRKHYFDKELNHHFFRNYFDLGDNNDVRE